MQWQGPRRSRAIWDETRKPNAPRGALLRAILYELQPIRFSTIDTYSLQTSIVEWVEATISFVKTVSFIWVPRLYHVIRNRTWRQWVYVLSAWAYWKLVVFLHRTLNAGPSFLMLSALVAIFTIGLGDNSNSGQLSAYSVFNRGFQSLIGDLDADALVDQHVGGGLGFGINRRRNRNDDENVQGNRDRHHHHNQQGGNDDGDGNANGANRARKSGKKARRKQKMEQRNELRRQREEAAARGLREGGEEDAMAMNRLVEEQGIDDDFEHDGFVEDDM